MTQADLLDPNPQPSRGEAVVLTAGLATTTITLLLVWLVTVEEFNPMGWYVWFVLPVGALIVGALAGSGYCLAAWLRGVRLSGLLLLSVLVLQVAAYFAGQYLEYKALVAPGARLTFWQYFDLTTQAFAFKGQNGQAGNPMGGWGYAFRLLEIAGFAAGALIVLAILAQKPYCEACRAYQRTVQQLTLPAGVKPRKVNKKDTAAVAAYEAECRQAYEAALGELKRVVELALEDRLAEFLDEKSRRALERKATEKLTARFRFDLQHCPHCARGKLVVTVVAGQGEYSRSERLLEAEVKPEFVRRCVAG
jgi:hypothetical protein